MIYGQVADSTVYSEIGFRGYVKTLQSLFYDRTSNVYSTINILHNRINIPVSFSDHLSGRLDIRNRLFFGDQIKYIPDFPDIISQYNGVTGLSWVWLDQPGLTGHTVVDRLWLSWNSGPFKATLGRQRLNWGITNFWTLNDVFNTYNFLDFDYEERPGSDAASFSWQINTNHALTLAAQPRSKNIQKVYAAMYKGHVRNYDIQLILGNWHDYYLLAGGWAGSIGNTGFKGEWNYFYPSSASVDSLSSFSATVMVDRTFPGEWYANASILYNANPQPLNLVAAGFTDETISAKNIFPFRWTFSGGFSKTIAVLYALSFNLIYTPENHTTIFLPVISRDMGSDIYVDLTGQLFFSTVNSSYQHQAYALYFRGKWSF